MSQPPDRAALAPTPDPSTFWDQKYDDPNHLYGTRPNAFLVDQAWRLPPRAKVLAVADGEGRNGVWLAQQGHAVMAVDASPRGLQKAAKLALDRGVALSTMCADLCDWDWPESVYDAVVAIFFQLPSALRATLHRRMLTAVKPGGLVILEAFRPEQLPLASGGPKNPDMLYTPESLRDDFAAADLLLCEPAQAILDEGPGHSGPAELVRLIARRPA